MTGKLNHQIKLAARPVGMPKRSDWDFATAPVPQPGEGEVLVKILYLSLDPAMRGWMNDRKSYLPPVGIGEVMRAIAAGRVVASNDSKFAPGDYVSGRLGAQEYASVKSKELVKIDTRLASLPVYLSALGMPGMTAYFGLLEVGKPKTGETVVVSAASGAVGALVGQIAKIKGCRAIGIAGGREKCEYVRQLGFDAAIDYKSENVANALHEHCPNGLDVYFDNVGGEILEAALARLAFHARIVICGAISQYNNTTPPKGPGNYMSLLVYRARMEGFLVMDYAKQYAEAIAEMAGWLKAGKLRSREDVVEGGVDAFPETLVRLFKGENFGKLILKIADD